MCEVAIAHRKPRKVPRTHTSQVLTKMGSHAHIATCYRTSQVMLWYFLRRPRKLTKSSPSIWHLLHSRGFHCLCNLLHLLLDDMTTNWYWSEKHVQIKTCMNMDILSISLDENHINNTDQMQIQTDINIVLRT